MINGVSGASSQVMAQLQAAREPLQTVSGSGSGALPEAPSAFDIAQQIQQVQTDNVKRALDAQTLVLDLLA